ncbi:HNH endonuclease [Allokutzneria sp. A3M-2-11 16]|uniref:HNH endonuclease signature motif containing protein n=1 Tax=Allokutzneria sp. A3M-2-11 16 TaxID=2962043 RepID=UPI0020B65799|nr:HNH endonuclease signature motif containing protein [Allokutzneria sp. A3M-2-11 16]MCP3802620.1 HNH endonuclease [Allokutzneria sp. A3M-2-11 16]
MRDELDDVEDAFRELTRKQATLTHRIGLFLDSQPPSFYPYAAEEVAALLSISRRAAATLVNNAELLLDRPALLDAMTTGALDQSKALLIAGLLLPLSPEKAAIAEKDLLAFAPKHTYGETRGRGQRLVIKLDPEAALAQHEEKRKTRRVEKLPQDDAMCDLRLCLTAVEGVTVWDRIDRIARALPKDGRTMDQKRADVAVDLLLGKATPAPQGAVKVQVTMPITALMGLNQDPGMLAGYGAIPAPLGRELAADGTWKRILTDPTTGIAQHISTTYRPSAALRELIHARHPHCTAIGCRQPAHRCDIDHCCPFDGTNTTAENLRPKCRHHHRMKTHTPWHCDNLDNGQHVWTTPTGRVYPAEPEPIADPAPF